MRKTSLVATVLAAGALVLSGCGSDDDTGSAAAASSSAVSSSAPSSSAAAASSSASASGDALLKTADSASYGTIVVDGKGMTVYMFDKDTQGSGASSCSGQCLVAWPPVIADSATPPVDGVTGEVGSITRDDGTTQATLDGWPLYYWQGDAAPGDATGQGVQGVWWVLSADGARVTTPPSS
jgi:predicted lipoprotein with Yx(FWY)xxD motif